MGDDDRHEDHIFKGRMAFTLQHGDDHRRVEMVFPDEEAARAFADLALNRYTGRGFQRRVIRWGYGKKPGQVWATIRNDLMDYDVLRGWYAIALIRAGEGIDPLTIDDVRSMADPWDGELDRALEAARGREGDHV
jgi:hypothetical protein